MIRECEKCKSITINDTFTICHNCFGKLVEVKIDIYKRIDITLPLDVDWPQEYQ